MAAPDRLRRLELEDSAHFASAGAGADTGADTGARSPARRAAEARAAEREALMREKRYG